MPRFIALLLMLTGVLAADSPWSIETVDTAGPAKSSEVRVDAEGNLHVVYVVDEGNRHPLKYAFWDRAHKKWFAMQIAELAATASLALDSQQRPHISVVDYGTASGSKLRYLYWNGKAWVKEAIPLSSDVIAYFSSIALDSQDRPSISFYEYRGPRDSEIRIRLRNVSKTAGYWQVRTVDPQEGSGKFNCMVAGGKNQLVIAYANVATGTTGLRLATWKDGVWRSEVVESGEGTTGETVGFSACVALDADGDPHVTYSNASRPGIRYASRKQGKWTILGVDALAGVGYPDRNGIAIAPDQRPYLSYFDAGRGELRVAYPSEPGSRKWVVEVVDAGGCGFNSSIRIHDGSLMVSYGDGTKGTLKVARRPLAASVSSAAPSSESPQAARRQNP
ncbi:MAG: hypothetical protein IT162_04190 [Bryobacterales bacterium]|nr:hypothetical protein [Bryobacterales bacterium]